jgi:hypothetical protein
LYELFGGWVGVQQTPEDIVQRQRLRIVAVMNYDGEQAEEMKEKQAEQERELEKLRQQR